MLRSVFHVALLAAALSPAAALAQSYDVGRAPAGTTPAATYRTSPDPSDRYVPAPYAPAPYSPQPVETGSTYSEADLVDAGHEFFGQTSTGLAQIVRKLTSELGEPNGYILGQEGSGAVFGGLRYGEGTLNTATMGTHGVFWQGPSLGWDIGGSGSRVMMLVYKLRSPQDLMQRFGGIEGSAYIVGGLAMNVLAADEIVLVPVRTGVGARLGVNVGYLKFTAQPTWNPF